jgi:hypothetical protein
VALAADALARIHDPRVDFVTSPGLSRDIEEVLSGADAAVIFSGNKE